MSHLPTLYKDTAWYNANATLVIPNGQKIYFTDTNSYVLGDGVTQLQNLNLIKDYRRVVGNSDYALNNKNFPLNYNLYVPYNISGNDFLVVNNNNNFNTSQSLTGNNCVLIPFFVYKNYSIFGISTFISVAPSGRQGRYIIAKRTAYNTFSTIFVSPNISLSGITGFAFYTIPTPLSLDEGIYFIGLNVNNTITLTASSTPQQILQSNNIRPYYTAFGNIVFANPFPSTFILTDNGITNQIFMALRVTIN